jgi:hypothetical protein
MTGADHARVNSRDEPSVTRRSFLGALLGFGTVVMGAALSIPLIRFALHPLVAKTTEIGWSDVGKMDEFFAHTLDVQFRGTKRSRSSFVHAT